MAGTSDIWMIVDTSGSMAEGRKMLLSRAIALEVAQLVRMGYLKTEKLHLARTTDAGVEEVKWDHAEEYPATMLSCHGHFNGKGVAEFLATIPNRGIILTDGFWNRKDREAIRSQTQLMAPNMVRIIRIGMAAPTLRGINVFDAEDLSAALDAWRPHG